MNRYIAYFIMMAFTALVIYLLIETSISKGLIIGIFGSTSYFLGFYSKDNENNKDT